MTNTIPPSLERFGQHLDRAAHRELSTHSGSVRARVPRPRLLAGGTLGLAGVAAAVIVALSGPAASPAFAITKSSDGSVLVHLNINSSLPQVNAKLASMGTHEQIGIQMAPGAAPASGPVTCAPSPDVSGPAVRVLDGPNGTEVISPGQTGDNTGVGTWHLASCGVYPAHTSLSTLRGYSGNS
jgi:hypothetical protein